MMKLPVITILWMFTLFLSGGLAASELDDFSSDGCSLFPDKSLINQDEWYDCCFEHDVAYWQGGTKEERKQADVKLQQCVYKTTGDRLLADMMYHGVRFGGSPYFYNWYRWGYGWDYGRNYQALTTKEKRLVERKLNLYYAKASYCGCD